MEQSNAGLESMLAALNGVGGATTRGAPYRGAYGFDPVLRQRRIAASLGTRPYAHD